MSDSLPENYGQGDNGVTEESGTTDSTAVESNEEKVNPYWADALQGVPDEFHKVLTPKFQEWDKNYARDKEKLSKFEQYSPFLENGVGPEDINNSLQLANVLQNNPRELFDYLREQHNFTVEEANNAVEEQFDVSTDGFDLEKDPRFQELQQQTQTMQQFIQQQENAKLETQMRSQVDQEVKAVTEKYPMFDIADVAAMATGMANARGNVLPNLIEAAEHMAKMLPQNRVSDSAPPTLSGNRGIPSERPNFGKMTSDQRSAYVAAQIEAANRQ